MSNLTVVFFDGACNLCNRFVDWVMRLDKKQVIRFGSLQGTAAHELLGAEADAMATLIVVRHGDIYRESDAVIQIGLALGGLHALGAQVLATLPQKARNGLYRIIAQRRYRIFGRRDICRRPTAADRAHFID